MTQTEEEMNEWVKNICSLCGFKVKEDGDQLTHPDPPAARPGTYAHMQVREKECIYERKNEAMRGRMMKGRMNERKNE